MTFVDENGVVLYHENLPITDNGYYVEAKDLKVGDVFLDANGELSTLVQTCREEYKDGITVYNFEVAGNHNYFVIARDDEFGQTCVLVHNATGYRAVSQAEYDDILNSGGFRPGYNTMPGKWFATTEEGAEGFIEGLGNMSNPPVRIVGGQIDDALVWGPHKNWDGIADSFYVPEEHVSKIVPILEKKR